MELLTDIERSLVYDEIEVLRDREAWLYLRSNSMQAGRLLAMGTGLLRRGMWAE